MREMDRNQTGNTYGVKLKDPELRQEAYRQYCAHLASGYPKECFHFNYQGHSACWKTVQGYIEDNPLEFPPNLLESAMAARYKHWFDEGKTLMRGGYKGGSPVVWQTIMRNMFRNDGWDREQSLVAPYGPPAIHPSSENTSADLVSEATIRANERLRVENEYRRHDGS